MNALKSRVVLFGLLALASHQVFAADTQNFAGLTYGKSYDNFSNSSADVLARMERITGRRPLCVEGDVRDRAALDRLFAEHSIREVIHFAALKAVGESVAQPLRYYEHNVGGTVALLQAMDRSLRTGRPVSPADLLTEYDLPATLLTSTHNR